MAEHAPPFKMPDALAIGIWVSPKAGRRIASHLRLSFARDGCRAYIAVAGGLKVTAFMGSASTYLPAEFGGHKGRALQTGDVLQVSNRPSEAPRKIPNGYTPKLSRHVVFRSRPAPEWEQMSAASDSSHPSRPLDARPNRARFAGEFPPMLQ